MWILLKNEFNYSLVKIEKYKKDFYKMVTVRTLKSFAMKTFVSSVCPGLPLFSLFKVRWKLPYFIFPLWMFTMFQ